MCNAQSRMPKVRVLLTPEVLACAALASVLGVEELRVGEPYPYAPNRAVRVVHERIEFMQQAKGQWVRSAIIHASHEHGWITAACSMIEDRRTP